jgi:hypothetical protein
VPPVHTRPHKALEQLDGLLPDAFRFCFCQALAPVGDPSLPENDPGGLLAISGIVGDLNACLCVAMGSYTAVRLFSAPMESDSMSAKARFLMEGLTRYGLGRLESIGLRAVHQGGAVVRVESFQQIFSFNVPVRCRRYHCLFGDVWQMVLPPTM